VNGLIDIIVRNTSFVDNRAFEGGVVYATWDMSWGNLLDNILGIGQPIQSPTLSLSNSSLQQNSASVGGAVWLKNYNTTLNLTTTMEGNIASAAGGAVYLLGGNMHIQDQVLISNNSAAQGGGIAWYSSCLELGACPSSLHLAAGAKVVNNNASIAGGVIITDVSLFANFTRYGTVLNNSASLGDHDVLYAKAKCDAGEVLKGGWCEKCASNMYTFASDATECKPCPLHANCTGGNFLQPNPGYWHSDRYSSQVHACPNIAACTQDSAANSSNNSQPAAPSSHAARATAAESNAVIIPQQCAAGYEGNACGVCMSPADGDKYGLSSPFVCKKCRMSPSASIALYAVLLLCMVAGLTYMAHATWLDNQEVTSEMRVSDVLKVLILYVQYLVVLGTARVAWPGSLAAVFSAASLLFASSTGQFLSLDCLMMEVAAWKVPMPVVKQLIYLVLPLAVIIGVCMASALFLVVTRWWSRRRNAPGGAQVSLLSALVARLPVIVLVVLYTFYPSLVRVGLSFFACLRLDEVLPPGDGEVANATAYYGYWVYSMQQECLVEWHKVWALSMGIPCVLIFCLGVPVAIVAWLVANKVKLYEQAFRQHFGSLYRNFRPKRFYWEAVVAVQTLVLVAVAVFSHTVGAYYQLVMFAFLFSISLVLQVWFLPYAFSKLHHLQLSAMGCLYFTAFISLTFIDVGDPLGKSADDYRFTMGIVLLILNVAFVCWAVYNLTILSKGAVASALEAVEEGWVSALEAVKEGWLGFRGWVAAFRRESRGAASVGGSSSGIEITNLREPKPETPSAAQV